MVIPMKKSLIVTTQYVNNYGAVLQAYGMHRFMEKFGWEHEFLNQIPADARIFSPLFPVNSNFLYIFLTNIRRLAVYGQLNTRLKRFAEFRSKHLPQTKIYKSQQEVLSAALNYDVYITGGDQMFNRSCLNRPVNLLRFGNENATRISYSTSMGTSEFSDEEKTQFFDALSNYTELSFREESALEFVERAVDVPCRTSIDGSFLIDKNEWNNVAVFDEKKYPSKYILVYELLPHIDLNKAVSEAKKQLNIPVIVITTLSKSQCTADFYVRNAGPAEFLGFFANASYVITTSFHGTCFSVINEIPFVSLISKKEKRINKLLNDYHLENHCKLTFDTLPSEADFSTAKHIVEKRKAEAAEYLARYLE